MRTTQIVEALLFASDAPLTAADLARVAEGLDEDAVDEAVRALREEYEAAGRAFQVYELAGGYQLLTRPEYAPYLERFDTVPHPARLSGPALEVLAIVAYRQPLDRAEIEEIRGVGSAGVLRTLLDRGLIEVVGRGEGLGRPLLYGTTARFLEHFGFRSLEDLPRPDELPVVLRERGREVPPREEEGSGPEAGAPGPAPDAGAAGAPEPTASAGEGPGPAPDARASAGPPAVSVGPDAPEPAAPAADPPGPAPDTGASGAPPA